ncbi:ABC transporter ATP-binding protein [Microbispora sp. NEAU-D428]|uniref:dipeptide ABC transporter ATP-binding protein n=1 Tax=Microbispora sitophila TaxID=2771537 RepID=UPI001868836C|nr:ABC transporter ATP-binding protein [Microbispora sitophila]MBE3012081.1 ABC transporter ATP-binding protein [Microbispora sitophila]
MTEPSQQDPLLVVRGLRVSYRTPAGRATALDGLDLDVHPGQITAVVGESGSGKTTAAHALVGLLPEGGVIESGSVRFQGEELTGLSEKGWRGLRGRRIALIPQDPATALDPVQPVGRQVAAVLRVHRLATPARARARAVELLAEAGLRDAATTARQYPHELSGGMRQRVLIAVAMAARPHLLIADEPTSALDVTVQRRILDHLDHVVATTGAAMLLITHDLGVVADRAQHVVVMSGGRAVEAGPARRIRTDPRDPYTRRLLADVPALTGRRPAPAPTEAAVLLSVRGLGKSFPVRSGPLRRRGTRNAVEGVDFDIPKGTTLGLVGESGSGKTTTARMILGLERPTAGSVRFAGEDVTAVRGEALRRLRRRVQLVYQNPYASLHPRFTVEDLLTEPMRNYGVGDPAGRAATVRALLDDVALPTSLARRRAGELSGGQRQRVAIARALSLNPDLLVCDEPVSALDVTVQAQILELLARLQRERGLSYLFISHDLAVVRQVSHSIAVMRGGRIVEQGDTEQVFTSPRHPYTRELLAAIPGFRTQTEEPQWS